MTNLCVTYTCISIRLQQKGDEQSPQTLTLRAWKSGGTRLCYRREARARTRLDHGQLCPFPTMAATDVQQWRDQLKGHLDGCNAFWLQHSVDHEHGGFFNNLDRYRASHCFSSEWSVQSRAHVDNGLGMAASTIPRSKCGCKDARYAVQPRTALTM